MEIEEFGLGPATSEAAKAAGYGTMTKHAAAVAALAFEPGRDALVAARLGPGGEAAWLLPLVRWTAVGEGRRALVVAAADDQVGGVLDKARLLTVPAGLETRALGRMADDSDADAPVVVCSARTLATRLEAGDFTVDAFGLLVVLDADRQAVGAFDRLAGHGGRRSDRRVLVFCERLGAEARRVAELVAPEAETLELEAGEGRARSAPCRILRASGADKARLAAGLLRSSEAAPVAVICNLDATARDLHAFLREYGLASRLVDEGLKRPRAMDLLRGARGSRTALVMTDAQVDAFPPGSFPLVIGYDLPLEGEPWLARSDLLDAEAPGAEVIGIACERYDFGLPAIERALGASLAVIDADPSLYAESTARADEGRSDREPGRDRTDERRGDAGRRDGGGRDRGDRGGQRDGRRERRDQRGERRSGGEGPDPQAAAAIRAGISAITGQMPTEAPSRGGPSVERNTEGNAEGKPGGNAAPKRRKRGRGKAGDGKNASMPSDGSREATRGSRPDGAGNVREPGRRGKRNRGGNPVDGGRRGDPGKARNDQGRRGADSGALEGADPYAMPMEERLRMYRERYGSPKGGSGRAAGPRQAGGRRSGGQARGQNGSERAPRGERPAARDSGAKEGEARTPAGGAGRPEAPPAKGGFLGRLFGGKRSRPD